MRLTVSVYKLTEKSLIYYLTCAIFTHKVNKPVTICTLKRDPVCHVTRTRRQPAIDPSSGNSLTQAGKTFSIIHRPSSLARGCSTLSNSLSLSIHHHLLYPWIKKHGGRLNLIHFHIYQNSLHDFSQNFPARSLTCSSRRQEPLAPSPDQRRLVQIMHDCFWCNLVQTHLVVAFYRMVRTQYKNTHFKHCSICVVCFIWFTCV